MTIIVEYVKYIIELMTYLFFIKNILEYQLIGHKTQKILMIILFGIFNMLFPNNEYISFIINIFLIGQLVNESIMKRIAGALISVITVGLFIFVPYSFLEIDYSLVKMLYEIGVYLGTIGLLFILKKAGMGEIFKIRPVVGVLNAIALLFFVVSLYIFLDIKNVNIEKVILFNLLLSFTIWIATLIYSFKFLHNKKLMIQYENESIQKEIIIEIQENYYLSILNHYENIKKFKHDIKAHLLTMQYLLNEENYEELKKYMNDFDIELKQIQNYNFTNHDMINAIITQFYDDIKESCINFKVSDLTQRELRIQSMEIVSLFYNLMSNAIEAAKQTDNKNVIITIKSNVNSIFIEVKNSVSINFDMNNIYNENTTKSDRFNHGIGLTNIKNVVKKYNGYINYHKEGQYLMTHIVIFD